MTDPDRANLIPAANANEVLTYLVKSLVDEPDSVLIEMSEGGRRGGVRFDVRCAPGDMGRLIGKRGRTAQSIRTVVRAAATKDDIAVDVEFLD